MSSMAVVFFRPMGRFKVPMLICLFLLLASALHAGGRKEESLKKADDLIARRLYNEAILELTSLVRREPRFFDDAQRRLQRIVRLREEYNQTAAELLDVLVNDPTNDERKLAMIRRLEELDAAPNRSAREFLIKTKETAQFTYNRAVFEKIMAEGRALIDAGSYAEAARKYTEGFVLYRDEFYAAGYEEAVIARVENHLATVDQENVRFAALLDSLAAALAALERAAEHGEGRFPQVAAVDSALRAFEDPLLALATLRNASARAGRSLENEFLLLQGADPSLTDSSWLPFVFRFVLGRKTEVRPEGILGAMDTLFLNVLNRSERALVSLADDQYEQALALADRGDPAAAALFAELSKTADLAMQAVGHWSTILGSESIPLLTAFGRSIVNGKLPLFIRMRELSHLALFEERMLALAMRYEPYKQALPEIGIDDAYRESPPETLLTLRDSWARNREAIQALSADIRTESLALGQSWEPLQRLGELTELEDRIDGYYTHVRNTLAALQEEFIKADTLLALAQYGNRDGELASQMQPFYRDLDEARVLVEGPAREADDGAAALPVGALLYPDRALEMLLVGNSRIDQLVSGHRDLLALAGRDLEYVRADLGVRVILDRVNARLLELATLRERNLALQDAARERIAQAENARREGDRLYAEARAALGRNAFDVARDRLRRASERYDFSLSLQESANLRALRDERLLGLSNEITQAENELVIRDVRRLINAARNFYFAGNFERAEDSLVQADLRWKTTNVEDESEIVYWLTLVRGALSVRSGRSRPVTAPLYPEMSQLLSFARRSFDEGRDLLDARRRVDALNRFEEAERYIRDVQIVFPLNQEASLLMLRIEQLRDPAVFNETFRTRVNSALAKEKSAPQEAYTELQDLYEINPRYQGLRTALERIEIALGLRLPPPDRAALARSVQLVRDARRIVDANLRAQFPVALEQLNEAIRLDPRNEAAVNLKVRIQTDAGGSATIVLSYEAEQEYRRAVAELQKGNAIVANAIVERLMQDPRNRSAPQLVELQKRIQSRLR